LLFQRDYYSPLADWHIIIEKHISLSKLHNDVETPKLGVSQFGRLYIIWHFLSHIKLNGIAGISAIVCADERPIAVDFELADGIGPVWSVAIDGGPVYGTPCIATEQAGGEIGFTYDPRIGAFAYERCIQR
jgi:hypothetical protein